MELISGIYDSCVLTTIQSKGNLTMFTLNPTVKKALIVIGGTALAGGAAYLAVRNWDSITSVASTTADAAVDTVVETTDAVADVAVSALSATANYVGELV